MAEGTKQRDAPLLEDFLPLAVSDYEFLRYTNERGVRDAFLAGAVEEPALWYGDIALAYAEDRIEDVRALTEVVRAYGDAVVRRAYLPKLEETQMKYELLRAAEQGEDTVAHEASVRMYGAPREDIFHYSQRELQGYMERVASARGGDVVVRRALETLAPAVSGIPEHKYSFEEAVFPAVNTYEDKVPLTATEVRDLCVQALDSFSITDWQVLIDAPGERITFNTNQDLRTVFIPSDEDLLLRKHPLVRERVESIIAHEIGTHVLRRERGFAAPLGLLGIGLAGYLRGEEGIATYAEQVRDGTRHFSGGFGYLAVGWAMGLDGTPRTFRALYEVLEAYCLMRAIEHALTYTRPIDVHLFLERARHQAWARCVRTFRGTTGSTPGACFTKDIVYREGNIAIWELIHTQPTVVNTFSLGKFDPANIEHVDILKDLGMLG
jgi:hypothetical protein